MSAASAPGAPVSVALDVGWLGAAYGQRWMRTGLYRVVERTSTLLAARGDVRLRLCANEHHEGARLAAYEAPALRDVPFAGGVRRRLAGRVRVAQAELDGRGYRPPPAIRVARRGLREAYRLLAAAARVGPARGEITPAALAGADVYHSPVLPLPAPLRGRRAPTRFLTVHDVLPQRFPALAWPGADVWNRRMLDSLTPADWVLTISRYTRDDLLDLRPDLDPARVVVAPLAADADRFYPCRDAERQDAVRRRYGIPPGVPYVLSVGSLVPHKNVAALVAAFARVVRDARADDLHLVLTGPKGWDPEMLETALAGAAVPRERVVLTGHVDDDDLAALYSAALVFGFPSLFEGFGLPPLEAMQCGTPVVASNRTAVPEVVGGGGLLVDPEDPDALAAALGAVYADAGLRARLAAEALAQAARFSWARYADQVVAAYRAGAAR